MSDIGSSRHPAIELVDVLPIKQQRPVGRGGRLLVTSVELWSHGLRWHGSEIPQPENAGPHLVHCWMSDDVGTIHHGAGSGGSSRSCDDGVYSVANGDDIDHRARSNGADPWPGGEGGSGSSWWTFFLDFEPAVPPDARQIILSGPPLTHGDGSPDGRDDFLTTWITDPDGNRLEQVQWPAGHAEGITAADWPGDTAN